MSIPITPTVGRVVWFFPSIYDDMYNEGKELVAQIAYVHPDGKTLNLGVLDAGGTAKSRVDIPLIQPGEELPADPFMGYATWTLYEVQQHLLAENSGNVAGNT